MAVGMVFMPRTDLEAQERCRTILETEIRQFGYQLYGWRRVPVNTDVIGDKAKATRPEIEQILIANSGFLDQETFEHDLYIIRRRAERAALAAQIKDFYICSLSAKNIVYKGLFLAEQLSVFYPDLNDERFVSRYALFHQRYSTNTFPQWSLAQPFRTLAHNGEINTIRGNKRWMQNHEIKMASMVFKEYSEDIKPVILPNGSDSSALDNVFEVLLHGGRSALKAKQLLMPNARTDDPTVPQPHKDMFDYCNAVIEPWDGPAAIAATDGDWVLGGLDRNGLRPMRYFITNDGLLTVGSEAGMVHLEEKNIVSKGNLGPGELIGLNVSSGELLLDKEIKDQLSSQSPYGKWIKSFYYPRDIEFDKTEAPAKLDKDDLLRKQKSFGISFEDMEMVLHPMLVEGKEAMGSMGDDTPPAVISKTYRNLSHFFRQNFSQVTNPPLDSLREKYVMSLETRFGNFVNVLNETSPPEKVLQLDSPVMTNREFRELKAHFSDLSMTIDCTFKAVNSPGIMTKAIQAILDQAENAALSGTRHIFLSDEGISSEKAGLPMILVTSAVHSHLLKKGLRTFVSLNVRSGECIDPHYFAVLIGVGATTVNAYLAQDAIQSRHAQGLYPKLSLGDCVSLYKKAINSGLLKILSKMGISTISSYRGAMNFEAIGLSRALVNDYFPGLSSKLSGIGIRGLKQIVLSQHSKAWLPPTASLPIGGFYTVRQKGETHANDAKAIHTLQNATRTGSRKIWQDYLKHLSSQPPTTLRDLLDFKSAQNPVDLGSVEARDDICKRFVAPSMSLGALSKEAHETLAIAMNRLKAKAASGEGGEDPERFTPDDNGDLRNSSIKQVASGRFGVTAEYLNACEEIEIKVAQGAKPGEGGQLPGFKVTDLIARLRHSTKGVTLISPPPHHDIYSIEDLAQLIYDLKQINAKARVAVKLVSSAGIGTIAAGVVKAKADVIHVSGHSGGTGASALSSIKHAGTPWEMGLAEVNQVLTLNGLRHKVKLRVDGGLKTGRDIVIAAILGAEEFGIGTASLIAIGCLMVRQCHSNTCPVGICTQDEALREKFDGSPEKVIGLMHHIADDVRELLSTLGYTTLDQVISRTDLLRQVSKGDPYLDDLDMNPILARVDSGYDARVCTIAGRNEVVETLDQEILSDIGAGLSQDHSVSVERLVQNTHRSVGTYISGHMQRTLDVGRLQHGHVHLHLRGSAGQSLGGFAVHGLKITVEGDANDFVGKGLCGGQLIVYPDRDSQFKPEDNVIAGNTLLYGATSGQLFAAGRVGERFAVRNSGAEVVVEGCGSCGCEYMTGGVAVILGPVGKNFGAGMTGGTVFVYDKSNDLANAINPDNIDCYPIISRYWQDRLKTLVENHVGLTNSHIAQELLRNWEVALGHFKQVVPKEVAEALKQMT